MSIWPVLIAVLVGVITTACGAPLHGVPPQETPGRSVPAPAEDGIDMNSARDVPLLQPSQVRTQAQNASCLVTWLGFTHSGIGYELFRRGTPDAKWELVAAVPHSPDSTAYAWLDPHPLGGGRCLYGVASVANWGARSEIRAAE